MWLFLMEIVVVPVVFKILNYLSYPNLLFSRVLPLREAHSNSNNFMELLIKRKWKTKKKDFKEMCYFQVPVIFFCRVFGSDGKCNRCLEFDSSILLVCFWINVMLLKSGGYPLFLICFQLFFWRWMMCMEICGNV